MKKILSVLLAVMMLFGALSVSASASDYVNSSGDALAVAAERTVGSDKTHFVVHYNLNGFTMKYPQWQYNTVTKQFESVSGIADSYYQIPQDANELYNGYSLMMPAVSNTSTYQFDGWICVATKQTYAANYPVTISPDMVYPGSGCIEFSVAYSQAEPEEDTMGTIMGILVKVFGAIIGILFYNADTAAGVQLMEQILGGLSL